MIFTPCVAEDGITHINTYSKAVTEFGRDMSNFSRIGFEHPTLGWFSSIEACWYYAATGCKHDQLRMMDGFKCKQLGRTFERVEMPGFELLIIEAHKARLQQNWFLAEAFWRNTLPLTHYYVHANGHCTTPESGVFQMAFLNQLRATA